MFTTKTRSRSLQFVGCDPGMTGAVVLLDSAGEYVQSSTLPLLTTTVSGKQRRSLDIAKFYRYLRECRVKADVTYFFVEEVTTFRSDGRLGAFNFGKNFGHLEAAATCAGMSVRKVRPQVWQKFFFKKSLSRSTKEPLTKLAIQKFPALREPLRLKKNQGLADAALIALYGISFID